MGGEDVIKFAIEGSTYGVNTGEQKPDIYNVYMMSGKNGKTMAINNMDIQFIMPLETIIRAIKELEG